MTKMIFINLPVKDLDTAERFYTAIGCEKNPQFSNENAVSMAWSDAIVFMLLKHEFFSTFITKPIADAQQAVGALYAFSCEDKAAVDAVTEAAGKAGGRADVRDPQDLGFMYSRAFADPDGNIFEPVYMDMSAPIEAAS
ncbi:VOC family protein [Pelagibacterium limicola]|uniref:VOC family protein n=1 Tax=Pelagibacterium limicola TaxID=2791022 RepID=UPI0018AF5DFB|nr:lactoylglutathione lyase [Pelagibacterium limicola]